MTTSSPPSNSRLAAAREQHKQAAARMAVPDDYFGQVDPLGEEDSRPIDVMQRRRVKVREQRVRQAPDPKRKKPRTSAPSPADAAGHLTDALLPDGRVTASIYAAFRQPAMRGIKPVSPEGRVSFHFRHDSIARTAEAPDRTGSAVTQPGVGSRHCLYIERDSAVPLIEEDARDASNTVDDDTDRGERPPSDGAAHERYIERDSATAAIGGGVRAVFSNISDDALERAGYWDRINAHAAQPQQARVTVRPHKAPAFWEAVLAAPDCPPELRTAACPKRRKRQRPSVAVEDADQLRRWLQDQPGFDDAADSVSINEPRGERVQFRIIGELPDSLDLAARLAILREFAAKFEKLGLPYVAALHAPDHNNDGRNWHFHLIYHDRPAKRMADGRWDFEVVEERDRGSRGISRHYPHRQRKHPATRSKQWVGQLRNDLAEITNRHLEAAGHTQLLDPRSFKAMGIDRDPSQHLRKSLADREAAGIPTDRGVSNAQLQWAAALAEPEAIRMRDVARHQAEADARRARAAAVPDNARQSALEAEIAEWQRQADDAAELRALARHVQILDQRNRSRAVATIAYADRQIAAIAAGEASVRARKRLPEHQSRRRNAVAFLAQLDTEMAPDLEQAARWLEQGERMDVQLGQRAAEIDSRLNQAARPVKKPAEQMSLMFPAQAQSPTMEGNSRSDCATAPTSATGSTVADQAIPASASAERSPARQIPSPHARIAARLRAALDLNTFIEQLAREGHRLRIEGGSYVVPSSEFLTEIGLPSVRFMADGAQARLKALHQTNQHELSRLEGYAAKRPETLERDGDRLVLGPGAPPDLQALSRKWMRDDELQRTFRELDARQKAQDRLGAVQTPAPTLQADHAPVANLSATQQGRLAPTPAPTAPVTPAHAESAPVSRGSPVVAPTGAAAQSPAALGPAEAPAAAPELQAPHPAQKVPTEPAAASQPTAAPAPASSRQDQDQPVLPSLSAADPQKPIPTAAPRRPSSAKFPKAMLEAMMTGAAPSRGLHPAIDAWYDACDTTMPVTERQRLAAVVEAAPDAASFIMLLSHADSRLLNEDAKTHRQRLKELSQQRSLGRDIG